MAIYYANSNSNDGRIIQIVGGRITTATKSSSSTFVNTGISKAITTKEAGSQIICVAMIAMDAAADGIYSRVKFCWTRTISGGGNTNTFMCSGTEAFGAYLGSHGSGHMRFYGNVPHIIFDPQSLTGTIAAGATVTYNCQAKCESHNNQDFRVNYGGADSFIYVMEVAS